MESGMETQVIEEHNPEWADLHDGLTMQEDWIPACAGMTERGNDG